MSFSVALMPAQIMQQPSSELNNSLSPIRVWSRRKHSVSPTARLFGPAIFEASKLQVLFLGVKEKKHYLPRTYTLTHSDITSQITLAISHTVNIAQIKGWYSRLQRDEVMAEWKKIKGETSLHVHCHISGGHFLLDLIAGLRYYIFAKELPVVLKAFIHGDSSLFQQYPELEEAPVWVYFQSNLPEFDRVEYWGPLGDATRRTHPMVQPEICDGLCDCCFPSPGLVQRPQDAQEEQNLDGQLD